MYDEQKADQDNQENGGIYPWLIVLGTFFVLIVVIFIQIGIMQNYFEQDEKMQGVDNLSLQLSFVGTIFNIFINLLGPLGQVLLSILQPRTVLFISVSICSLGLLLASFCKNVWQLYLTQGAIYGIGSSIMFYIALTIVPLWFVKHKGMALGIISSGISIGGLIMPQIMEPLNTNLGAAWCYRIMSLICFVVGVLSCALFSNNSEEDSEKKGGSRSSKLALKEMFDFSIIKNWRFLLWVFIDILLEGGYNVPYFFLPSYATFLGLSTSQGAAILSTSSGMNAFGRIIYSFIADYVGHVNIVIIYTIISGLSCLLLWVYANTFGVLMAFAIVFGFFGGAFITLTPTITLLVTGHEKFESGLSVFLVLTVASMFGPNLASAIESSSPAAKEYDSYKYFTGTCYLAGAILLCVFKLSLNRKPFAKI
ncbi:major facilitator superfamily domain-containing protein [Parasitella parasitica]|nr:major facilitator superfamily domain-containing protein [Parasitella parasitica]